MSVTTQGAMHRNDFVQPALHMRSGLLVNARSSTNNNTDARYLLGARANCAFLAIISRLRPHAAGCAIRILLYLGAPLASDRKLLCLCACARARQSALARRGERHIQRERQRKNLEYLRKLVCAFSSACTPLELAGDACKVQRGCK